MCGNFKIKPRFMRGIDFMYHAFLIVRKHYRWREVLIMYGYKLKKEGKDYYFALYPSNNHHQRVGQSQNYKSYDDCRKALLEFRNFVVMNNLQKPTKDKLNIIKSSRNGIDGYIFQYIKNGQEIFFRTIRYASRINCEKSIKSIYDHINDYTAREIID